MRKAKIPLTNFQYGELSPSLISRTDTRVYNASAQKVENFFLRAEGGVIKRAGLSKIYEFDTTVDATKVQQHRLVPFIFSDDERYIVSLEHQKIRVFQIDTNNTVSLATTITQDANSATLPFTNTNIHQVTYAQSGDVMFIAHQTFMVRKLVRTGLTSFQVETKTFDTQSAGAKISQPYFQFQDLGVTLDPSASSGNGITLTTSAAYWDLTGSQSGGNYPDSKHVGTTIRYHGQEIEITSVQSATQATGNCLATLKKKLKVDSFRTDNGVATVTVTLVNHGFSASDAFVISNADTVGGISTGNLNGSRTVSEVIDDNTFTFTAGANANDSTVGGGTPFLETHAPATNWEEQSYSTLRGFPGAVTFHQNRLWYGGTISQPDGLWASKSNEFFNFDTGEAADNDSIDIRASIGEVNTIGSSFVKPYVYDGATVYVQGSGEIVREMLFDDGQQAYTGQPISSLSSHLIKNPIQATTLAGGIDRAESYYFLVDADGTLAIFNSNRAEQRYGWTQFTSQGSFHSLCTVDTRVYAVVKFDKGDGTNKYILCEFDSSFNTDMAKTYSGSNGVFNVSADFANGAVLDVVSGTHYLGQFTVASGNIDVSAVDNSLSSAEIGFKFDVTLTTNPIDTATQQGVLSGEPRSLNKVIVDLSNTLSCSVNNKNLIIRQVTDDLSQARVAITGKKEFRLLGFSKDPQVTVSQSAPLSLQVNSIIAEITF